MERQQNSALCRAPHCCRTMQKEPCSRSFCVPDCCGHHYRFRPAAAPSIWTRAVTALHALSRQVRVQRCADVLWSFLYHFGLHLLLHLFFVLTTVVIFFETITGFKYLGSGITDEGSKPEILSRIAQTTAALTRLKPVWNYSISLSSKVRLMRTLVTSIFVCACESYTFTAELQRRI